MSSLSFADVEALHGAVVSVPARLGVFEKVNGAEPKNAPGRGLTCHVFVSGVVPATSGLNATSSKVTWTVRVLHDALSTALDMVEVRVLWAAMAVVGAYVGEFRLTLAALPATISVRSVDVRGMERQPIAGRAGYFDQDGKKFRAEDIAVSVVLNHVWAEVP